MIRHWQKFSAHLVLLLSSSWTDVSRGDVDDPPTTVVLPWNEKESYISYVIYRYGSTHNNDHSGREHNTSTYYVHFGPFPGSYPGRNSIHYRCTGLPCRALWVMTKQGIKMAMAHNRYRYYSSTNLHICLSFCFLSSVICHYYEERLVYELGW